MSRFANWRARRRSASRRTALRGRWQRGSSRVAPPATLAPHAASHLSDGVVVQTHLVARVLGLRLLKVDGVVHLVPARLEPWEAGGGHRLAGHSHDEFPALGGGLAHAAELVEDGDRRLS
jgi:hypothetical protein